MTNSKQWELELEEYGSMHNEGCPCMLEDPDGCDCDMNGLKPLFRNAINQAVDEQLKDIIKLNNKVYDPIELEILLEKKLNLGSKP